MCDDGFLDEDEALAVVLDATNNVVAAGRTSNSGTGTDFTVVKLAAADTESTRGILAGSARKQARYAAALLAAFAASAGALFWGHWL